MAAVAAPVRVTVHFALEGARWTRDFDVARGATVRELKRSMLSGGGGGSPEDEVAFELRMLGRRVPDSEPISSDWNLDFSYLGAEAGIARAREDEMSQGDWERQKREEEAREEREAQGRRERGACEARAAEEERKRAQALSSVSTVAPPEPPAPSPTPSSSSTAPPPSPSSAPLPVPMPSSAPASGSSMASAAAPSSSPCPAPSSAPAAVVTSLVCQSAPATAPAPSAPTAPAVAASAPAAATVAPPPPPLPKAQPATRPKDLPPPPAASVGDAGWIVVGGTAQGGILVREGRSTSSKQCVDRLSTGAVVEQLGLQGDRLQYRRLRGEGPQTGWVSIAISGKTLMQQRTLTAEDLFTLGRALDLQEQLIKGFAAPEFQRELSGLLAEHPSRSGAAFLSARRQLCLSVQRRVLPKFGFEANEQGVVAMMSAFGPRQQCDEVGWNQSQIQMLLQM